MENFVDVSDAFDGWTQGITITRKAAGGSYVDGLWVETSTSTFIISAVVQNANPDDMKVLPEGLQSSVVIKLHTVTALRTLSEEDESNADIVTYDGFSWLAHSVAARKIGGYYKVLAIRQT